MHNFVIRGFWKEVILGHASKNHVKPHSCLRKNAALAKLYHFWYFSQKVWGLHPKEESSKVHSWLWTAHYFLCGQTVATIFCAKAADSCSFAVGTRRYVTLHSLREVCFFPRQQIFLAIHWRVLDVSVNHFNFISTIGLIFGDKITKIKW